MILLVLELRWEAEAMLPNEDVMITFPMMVGLISDLGRSFRSLY